MRSFHLCCLKTLQNVAAMPDSTTGVSLLPQLACPSRLSFHPTSSQSPPWLCQLLLIILALAPESVLFPTTVIAHLTHLAYCQCSSHPSSHPPIPQPLVLKNILWAEMLATETWGPESTLRPQWCVPVIFELGKWRQENLLGPSRQ